MCKRERKSSKERNPIRQSSAMNPQVQEHQEREEQGMASTKYEVETLICQHDWFKAADVLEHEYTPPVS